MMPEDIHAKSPSDACVQKDGTFLNSCAPEEHLCNSKDRPALFLAMTFSTGKSAKGQEQHSDFPASWFSRQKQEKDSTNQVLEVQLQFHPYFCQVNINLLSSNCFCYTSG